MLKRITGADIALLFLLLALGAGTYLWGIRTAVGGSTVRIRVDGELFGTYPLSVDRTVVIEQNGHRNEVLIENGTVRMQYSDCANQICVHEGAVSTTNRSIICLPNRVVVEITGSEEDFDVIAQ